MIGRIGIPLVIRKLVLAVSASQTLRPACIAPVSTQGLLRLAQILGADFAKFQLLNHSGYIFAIFVGLLGTLAADPFKSALSARAAILINAETGAVLYEKNAHEKLYPASITKMITALYAIEKKGEQLEEKIQAPWEAILTVAPSVRRSKQHPSYRLEFGGTHMGIRPREQFSLRTLLYGLMLASANDAANVIASFVSGTIPQFVEELNQFVKDKGCHETQILNPHGLTSKDHYTTAYDTAVFAKEALKNPLFCEIVKTVQYPRSEGTSSLLIQHNALLKPKSPFFYDKAIGLKTGYTDAAGFTLVAAAEDENRKLVAVLLGCGTLQQRYKDAIALFEWGFQEKKSSRTLFSRGFDIFNSPVKGAHKPLQAHLEQDIQCSFYPSEEPVIHASIDWSLPSLPISCGQHVGKVSIYSQTGDLLASAPLIASHSLKPTWTHQFSQMFARLQRAMQTQMTWILAVVGLAIVLIAFHFSQE